MKIKTKKLSYAEVLSLPKAKRLSPKRPNLFFRTLVRIASAPDLRQTSFSYRNRVPKDVQNTPCLILMNHSSFIDLEIVSKILYPKPYCIVCTSDGFVGKPWLMRQIGCIPTQKFVSDFSLISDIRHTLEDLQTSVLMYPEASYSFDGCATPLPEKMGVLLKALKVPVISILTHGAFARDPLYNCLQKRKVKVTADVNCLFTKEDIEKKTVEELDAALNRLFRFDNFAWQQNNEIKIDEPFRADGLERILYLCPKCGAEGATEGRGIHFTCKSCGMTCTLDENGWLVGNDVPFAHIPHWYAWEREKVKQALSDGTYRLEADVQIGMMVDYKAIYMVGDGHLTHDENGFHLVGCDGQLDYRQAPLSSYSLYADYYWYELGDTICIGNKDALYYCFPKGNVPVAKARLAAEELYKAKKAKKRSKA